MRINGIGITFLGVSRQDESGIATATVWFTFIYFPIFPLRRKRIRLLEHEGAGYSYEVISDEKLAFSEILKTYIFGWLIIPMMGLLPLIVAIKEVWQGVGLPQFLHIPYIILTIIWILVLVWKLSDWHEARFHPQKK